MKEEELGAFFREKFEDFRTPPPVDGWEKLANSKTVANHNRRKKRRVEKRAGRLLLYVVAAIAIAWSVVRIMLPREDTLQPVDYQIVTESTAIDSVRVDTLSTSPDTTTSAPEKPLEELQPSAPPVPATSAHSFIEELPASISQLIDYQHVKGDEDKPTEPEKPNLPPGPILGDKIETPAQTSPAPFTTFGDAPILRLEHSRDTTICRNSKIALFVANSLKTHWHIGFNSDRIEVIPSESAVYYVDVVTPAGVDTTIGIRVQVVDCNLFIPRAFTPNADGLNDEFRVETSRNISNFEMSIFQPTGRLLFQSKNISQGWDGTYNGEPSAHGTYLYVITYRDELGEKHYEKGQIILIR